MILVGITHHQSQPSFFRTPPNCHSSNTACHCRRDFRAEKKRDAPPSHPCRAPTGQFHVRDREPQPPAFSSKKISCGKGGLRPRAPAHGACRTQRGRFVLWVWGRVRECLFGLFEESVAKDFEEFAKWMAEIARICSAKSLKNGLTSARSSFCGCKKLLHHLFTQCFLVVLWSKLAMSKTSPTLPSGTKLIPSWFGISTSKFGTNGDNGCHPDTTHQTGICSICWIQPPLA